MLRIVEKNRVSDFPTELRVERNFVRYVATRDAIVVLHHDRMNLKVSISKSPITNNGRTTIDRNFPIRDERYEFMKSKLVVSV